MKSPRPPSPRRRRLVAGSAAAALAGLGRALTATAATAATAATDTAAAATAATAANAQAPAATATRVPTRAPVLFIGHGSPMNTLRDTPYTRTLGAWGRSLARPRAVLMVSAHWLTDGVTKVSVLEHPRTIHDFSGFPEALETFEYAAPGDPALAREAAFRIRQGRVLASSDWGLDHGAWSVLHHLYPRADVPVFQVSIDYARPPEHHAAVGRDLAAFRDLGVLVVASGNIVHNLRATMRVPDADRAATPWAQAFDDAVRRAVDARDHAALRRYRALDASTMAAVPTPDHYFPLLYALGAAGEDAPVRHVHEGFEAGTISMRCMQFG